MRTLKEIEAEQLAEEHKHLAENERLRLAIASFVENLDQHQLFETLFANDTDIDLLRHMDHSTQLYVMFIKYIIIGDWQGVSLV